MVGGRHEICDLIKNREIFFSCGKFISEILSVLARNKHIDVYIIFIDFFLFLFLLLNSNPQHPRNCCTPKPNLTHRHVVIYNKRICILSRPLLSKQPTYICTPKGHVNIIIAFLYCCNLFWVAKSFRKYSAEQWPHFDFARAFILLRFTRTAVVVDEVNGLIFYSLD